MRISRTLGVAILTLSTVMLLASCGAREPDPSGDPTSPAVSESADGPVAPANWQEVKIDVAQIYLPPDWSVLAQRTNAASFAAAKDEFGLIPGSGTMGSGVNSPSGDVKADIEYATKSRLETYRNDPNRTNIKRLPDVTINDVHFSHFQWEAGQRWNSEYVTVTPDGQSVVTVGWGFTKSGLDREGSQDLIDPVMATFELL